MSEVLDEEFVLPLKNERAMDRLARLAVGRALRNKGLIRDSDDLRKRYTIVVEPDIHAGVKAAAAKNRVSMQMLVEEILKNWLDRNRMASAEHDAGR